MLNQQYKYPNKTIFMAKITLVDTNVTAKDVFNVLSKEDGRAIFVAARDGIDATRDIHSTLNLTKKRYYTRTKQLVKLGLIQKVNGAYEHTSLGSALDSGPLSAFEEILRNRKEFQMIDTLKRGSNFKPADIEKFVSKIKEG